MAVNEMNPEILRTVEIEAIASGAEGIAHVEGQKIYVPYVLPGETVTIKLTPDQLTQNNDKNCHGRLRSIDKPSPQRIRPFCKHFTKCGGCLTQHWQDEFREAWQMENLQSILSRENINTEIEPFWQAPLNSRRRASFKLRRSKKTVQIGFQKHRSHELVDLVECPVLDPKIMGLLPELRKHIAPLLSRRKTSNCQITVTETGFDVAFEDVLTPTPEQSELLIEVFQNLNIARIFLNGELLSTHQSPLIRLGKAIVKLPPHSFLQATQHSDLVMARIIQDELNSRQKVAKDRPVADLFAGVGTLSLPVSETHSVAAFDLNEAGLHALLAAAQQTDSLKPVSISYRDLIKEPLTPPELNVFACVIIDPPRSGALAQMKNLSQSRVPSILSVSCNIKTFARDTVELLKGGYHLRKIYPIDQFLFSSHMEIIGVFEK